MTSQRWPAGRRRRPVIAALVAFTLSAAAAAASAQPLTSPRLLEGQIPAPPPQALGGGEVVLELAVSSRGEVTRVSPLRSTPPYTDLVTEATKGWRFEPATALLDGRAAPVAGTVLVAAVFRPPALYSGPATGAAPAEAAAPSPTVPTVSSMVMPAYPPTAVGDGTVVVEIEMSERAEPRRYRIAGPESGFDAAALEAVRAWRFAPRADLPERLFVYAVLGFRAPVALPVAARD